MVDVGVLELDGQTSLEEVDGRYERVPSCDLCGAPSNWHTAHSHRCCRYASCIYTLQGD